MVPLVRFISRSRECLFMRASSSDDECSTMALTLEISENICDIGLYGLSQANFRHFFRT